MKDESIRISLEIIARRNIPENTNLWPRLAARIEQKDTLSMNMKWKLVWTILLVLLGLSALTGVAYAFYHYFNDAGLQSVSDAGLISTVNATAQPARMPTATPPEPVTVIGNSQTLEGVSLTLQWIYLMDGRQAFGFSAQGLSDGKTLGMPQMGFGPLIPEQYRGAGMAVKDNAQPVAGTYFVNQIVRDAATYAKTDTYIDVGIEMPLTGWEWSCTEHFPLRGQTRARSLWPILGRQCLFDSRQWAGNDSGLDPDDLQNHPGAPLLRSSGWERLDHRTALDPPGGRSRPVGQRNQDGFFSVCCSCDRKWRPLPGGNLPGRRRRCPGLYPEGG